jgi:hypothetical protein
VKIVDPAAWSTDGIPAITDGVGSSALLICAYLSGTTTATITNPFSECQTMN